MVSTIEKVHCTRTFTVMVTVAPPTPTPPPPTGCVNLSFAYVEGESLLMALKDVALSSGRCVCKYVSGYSTGRLTGGLQRACVHNHFTLLVHSSLPLTSLASADDTVSAVTFPFAHTYTSLPPPPPLPRPSACTSASLEPSYVLRAIGSDEDLAHSSIR